MGIWGKIMGGAVGFGLGGPIGALLGAAAGHLAVDKRASWAGQERIEHRRRRGEEERRIAFAVVVVALSAKLAKVDGHVSRDEVAVMKRVFRIAESESGSISAIFNEAKRDAGGFEPYARQIAAIFASQPSLLEDLLAALLMIAHADCVYHPAERRFLRRVAEIFGLGDRDFHRIEATFTRLDADDESNPYEILGVTVEAGDAEIKAAYWKLVRENHPDKLIAQGLPEASSKSPTERWQKSMPPTTGSRRSARRAPDVIEIRSRPAPGLGTGPCSNPRVSCWKGLGVRGRGDLGRRGSSHGPARRPFQTSRSIVKPPSFFTTGFTTWRLMPNVVSDHTADEHVLSSVLPNFLSPWNTTG